MSSGGVEAKNEPIQAIVGALHPGYPEDKGEACSSKMGGDYGAKKNRWRGRVG